MRLEDVEVNLKLHYEIDDGIIEEVQSRNMTDEELVEEFIEPNESKIKHKIEIGLHCLQRDYAYALDVHDIKINYPLTTLTFDVELDENDYDSLQTCKEMFVSSFTRTITHEPYQIYTVYGKQNDLTMVLVSVEVLGVHI